MEAVEREPIEGTHPPVSRVTYRAGLNQDRAEAVKKNLDSETQQDVYYAWISLMNYEQEKEVPQVSCEGQKEPIPELQFQMETEGKALFCTFTFSGSERTLLLKGSSKGLSGVEENALYQATHQGSLGQRRVEPTPEPVIPSYMIANNTKEYTIAQEDGKLYFEGSTQELENMLSKIDRDCYIHSSWFGKQTISMYDYNTKETREIPIISENERWDLSELLHSYGIGEYVTVTETGLEVKAPVKYAHILGMSEEEYLEKAAWALENSNFFQMSLVIENYIAYFPESYQEICESLPPDATSGQQIEAVQKAINSGIKNYNFKDLRGQRRENYDLDAYLFALYVSKTCRYESGKVDELLQKALNENKGSIVELQTRLGAQGSSIEEVEIANQQKRWDEITNMLAYMGTISAISINDQNGMNKSTSKEAMPEEPEESFRIKDEPTGETSYAQSSLKSLKNTDNFTDSAIEHIFEGQINGRGKAVGYHYEGIEGTAGKVIHGTELPSNEFGVYKAQVEVNGIPKTANGGYSTFYSKNMSPQEVVEAINEAYGNRVYIRGNTFVGETDLGVKIEMFLDKNDRIISVYPKY